MQKGRVAWVILWQSQFQEPALSINHSIQLFESVEPIPVLGKESTVSPSLDVAQKRGMCDAGVNEQAEKSPSMLRKKDIPLFNSTIEDWRCNASDASRY